VAIAMLRLPGGDVPVEIVPTTKVPRKPAAKKSAKKTAKKDAAD
jgi:hypothetical protein